MMDSIIVGIASSLAVISAVALLAYLNRVRLLTYLRDIPENVGSVRVDAAPFDGLGIDWSREARSSEPLAIGNRLILSLKLVDHPEVWEGFTGKYFAINAPWVVEGVQTDKSRTAAIATQVERYREGNCQAIYVFYEKGEAKALYPNAAENAAKEPLNNASNMAHWRH